MNGNLYQGRLNQCKSLEMPAGSHLLSWHLNGRCSVSLTQNISILKEFACMRFFNYRISVESDNGLTDMQKQGDLQVL